MFRVSDETTAPIDEATQGLRAMGIDPDVVLQDRYRILGLLGSGGNGVVVRAFDLKLGREVAIKTVRIGRERVGNRASDGLIHEAVALAQLRHPNIVQVFDVDRAEPSDQAAVWLIMEIVDGPTLRSWLEKDGHTVADVLRVFVQAGRGLQAAHGVGILHRDFKPQNVIVARDARVRVLDFGLARVAEVQASDASSEASLRVPRASEKITETGFVAGTPAFMAPEQFEGRTLPQSDQYSFCKSLAAGLYCRGSPPPDELVDRLRARPTSVASPRGRIPAPVARAISRGLAVDPDDRHPSISALLACIELRSGRRGWWWAPPAVATVGLAAWLGGGGARPSACGDGQSKLESVWSDRQRRDVETAVTGLDVGYGDRAWRDIETRLDDYASDWLDEYEDACETVPRDGALDPDTDLRISCLHRARLKLGAVAETLANRDADILARAHVVLDALVPLTVCSDAQTLRRGGPPAPPRHLAAEVARIRASIDQGQTARLAGKEDEARQALVAFEDSAALAEYPPVATELAYEQGMLTVGGGEFRRAERQLRGVLRSTLETGQRDLAVRAATTLISISGLDLAQTRVGRSYERVARGLLETLESPGRRRAALFEQGASLRRREGRDREALEYLEMARRELEAAEGTESLDLVGLDVVSSDMLIELGRYDEAVARTRRALEIQERLLGAMHPDVAYTRGALAEGLGAQGKAYESEAQWRVALSIRSLAFGKRHHLTANTRRNLGVALYEVGRVAEANIELTTALEVLLEVYGELHPEIATTRTSVAATLYSLMRFDESIAEFERAAEVRRAVLGDDHADVGAAYANIATVYMEVGRNSDALEALDRASAIFGRAHGWHRNSMGYTSMQRGECLRSLGRYAEAATAFEASLSDLTAVLGEDHVRTAEVSTLFASLLLTLGEHERALQLAEAAWVVYEPHHLKLGARTSTAFTLARALWANGQRRRARDLAQIAADVPPDVDFQSQAQQWLRRHGGPAG